MRSAEQIAHLDVMLATGEDELEIWTYLVTHRDELTDDEKRRLRSVASKLSRENERATAKWFQAVVEDWRRGAADNGVSQGLESSTGVRAPRPSPAPRRDVEDIELEWAPTKSLL